MQGIMFILDQTGAALARAESTIATLSQENESLREQLKSATGESDTVHQP